MGVSIFAVIKFKQFDNYSDFAEVNIPRSDKLLPAIAFGDGGLTDEMLYPPRGMPSDVSFKVTSLFFTDFETVKDYLTESNFENEEERTVEEYLENAGKWAVEQYQKTGLLPMPELYAESWLTFTELQKVLTHEGIDLSELTSEFRATLAAMQTLSEDFGVDNVRLVFWLGM
jgi:hypothetical protein